MKILDFISELKKELPEDLAWRDDPVGLQIFIQNHNVKNVGIAYELNSDVVNKAIEEEVNLLIIFHPLIYSPLKNILNNDRVSQCVVNLIKNDIAVYVVHTSFDAYKKGTSYIFAKKLRLKKIAPLQQHEIYKGYGMGAVGLLEQKITLEQLCSRIKELCNIEQIRFTKNSAKLISKVAILCGSGMSFYGAALRQNVEAFITSDVKYHDFMASKEKAAIIDVGHFESEKYVEVGLAEIVKTIINNNKKPNIKVKILNVNTNPISYL